MKIIDIPQNTPEWLSWRSTGLGASDAPVVLGVSPWKTPLRLWEERTGKVQKEAQNSGQARGHALEDKARAMFELSRGIEMPPACGQHDKHDFMLVSLDGYNAGLNEAAEIKCPGKEDHQTALDGKVPEKYIPQLDHQAEVSGVDTIYYVSFNDNFSGHQQMAVVVFVPNKKRQEKLVKAMSAFWKQLQTNSEPDASDRDYKVPARTFAEKFEQLRDAKLAQQQFEAQAKEAKDIVDQLVSEITKAEDHPRLAFEDVKINRIVRAGNVDYKKIPELRGIDLEPYRGKESVYYKVSLVG